MALPEIDATLSASAMPSLHKRGTHASNGDGNANVEVGPIFPGKNSLVPPGVIVADWYYPPGADLSEDASPPEYEALEFHDAQNFSEFLSQPYSRNVVSRLIHIRGVPWALPIIAHRSGRNYDGFTAWMAAPAMASNPREQVWYATHEDGRIELKFVFDYFALHPRLAEGPGRDRCAAAPGHLTNLTLDGSGGGDASAPEWCVCLQKLGVICYREEVGPAVAVVLHHVGAPCPPDWQFPLDVNWRREARLDPLKFSHRFFEHVLYWAIRGTAQRWFQIVRNSQTHFAGFEKEIFKDPENEAWGEALWEYSRHWNAYNRLFTLHSRLLEYLDHEGQRFLRLYWETRRAPAPADDYKARIGDFRLFGRLHKGGVVANQTEMEQCLVHPTMHMLDMIYKRVAIRDARHSLMLNESLWRLSWITFIFLPLTFITGIFGMNVDTFAENPSIKWWFIAAVPLMALVLLGWLFFRYSYVVLNRTTARRSQQRSDGFHTVPKMVP